MRRPRTLWTVLAIVALMITVVSLVVRSQPISNVPELVVTIGAPYICLTAGLSGIAWAVLSRRLFLSILAVWIVTAAAAVQVPWYYFRDSVDIDAAVQVRVLSSNLRLGRADPVAFLELASKNADVVTVSELTPAAVERLADAGMGTEFPYSVLAPSPGASGVGIYSRYPLTKVRPLKPELYSISAARLDVPEALHAPVIASVHVVSPVASNTNTVRKWQTGIAALKTSMSAFAVGAGPAPVIVAGDFNSTPDERQFRDLMINGYRDAVEQTGSGFAPTFPSRSWHPPLLTIDHVLTRNAAAQSINTVYVAGSDHRALLASIQIPTDPTDS